MCIFVKLGCPVNHGETMDPIDFKGQRSKVNVTIVLYSNNFVNTKETGPLCVSSSKMAYMLTLCRGCTYWLWRSKVKVIIDINGNTLGTQDWTVLCIDIHVNYNERMKPIVFQLWMLEVKGQRNLQMWVRGDATRCVLFFFKYILKGKRNAYSLRLLFVSKMH